MDTHTAPVQVTGDLIVDALASQGIRYFVDSEGEIGCLVGNRVFLFMRFGNQREVIQVRGCWNRVATIEHASLILDFCNKWNFDMVWPKAYYRVRDDGVISVFTEVSHDFEFGATVEQLAEFLMNGLRAGDHFFDRLDERFPDPLGKPA